MSTINLGKNLKAEGTISFKLTPIENGKEKLYLIDVGQKEKDRITLSVIKNGEGERLLLLYICNEDGECLEESEVFPEFKLGSAFDVELVWSSEIKKVAVFVNNAQKLEIVDDKIKFSDLGKEIHYGEDIMGENKSEMMAN